jgi:hypothetical protein
MNKIKIILAPMLLSSMMDYTITTAAPLRKDVPFVPRQEQFCLNVAKLILFINVSGYKCTFGETFRTKEQAQIYAKQGKGIVDSNHLYKLAVDLNLFDKDGKYVADSKSYEQFGIYWENLNKNNEWGGRWKIVDACHFEAD